jgi:molybdopterin molybdotransferase
LPLVDADRRVLAEDLVSHLQVPPHDNSSMDGYAVRAADVTAGCGAAGSQRIAAGHVGVLLEPGTCARIFTGAPMPAGADAVVMQEDTREVGGNIHGVHVDVVPKPGQWVRRAGEDVSRGAVVLATERDFRRHRSVWRPALAGPRVGRVQPRVALFSTGDELVMPGEVAPSDMPPGAIYNSNRFFLRVLLQRLGCEVSDLGIVPDRRDATIAALKTAADHHDLILTSGGVSVGEEDHIKPAVQQLGSLDLWQIAMKPGKPFAYGTVRRDAGAGAARVSLPFHRAAWQSGVQFRDLPAAGSTVFLLRLQGAAGLRCPAAGVPDAGGLRPARADKRREFLRVRRNDQGGLDLFPNQSSGVLTSASWADGLVDNPAGTARRPWRPGRLHCVLGLARMKIHLRYFRLHPRDHRDRQRGCGHGLGHPGRAA